MNRTTHRSPIRRRLRAATAVLLVTASTGGFAADAAPPGLRMMAIENQAQGRLVTDGRYVEAIEKIRARRYREGAFETQNNLCVAYTKTNALYKAVVACEAALEARDFVSGHGMTARQKLRDRAIALSNRGVLRAVMGDLAGAREDFAASADLARELSDPQQNLALITAAR